MTVARRALSLAWCAGIALFAREIHASAADCTKAAPAVPVASLLAEALVPRATLAPSAASDLLVSELERLPCVEPADELGQLLSRELASLIDQTRNTRRQVPSRRSSSAPGPTRRAGRLEV